MLYKAPLRVAMVAYANYFNDARIKNYVDALLDSGSEVDVIALGRTPGVSRQGGLLVRSVGTKYMGSNSLIYILKQLLFIIITGWYLLVRSINKKYDIIHVHNMPNIIILAAAPFKLIGTKVILDVHDTMPEAFATTLDISLEGYLYKLLIGEELFSALFADRVIATNMMHENVLIGHGISKNKIIQVLNVGNPKVFKPRTHWPAKDPLWLGYHGTIAKRLGLFLIVDALSLLKTACPNLRFLCVGGGIDALAMKRKVSEKGIAHMVEWIPFVEVESLPEVLKEVNVGIVGNLLTTEEKNNFMLPVKVLEYAAMEIPTIVPRLRVLESYFNERMAFFYTPDDAIGLAATIKGIYLNKEIIEAKISGLREFNHVYNWGVMAKRYLGMITEIVN